MLRKLLIAGAAAALLLAAPAASPQAPPAPAPTTLMPGVTYEDGVQFTPHGPVAIHVIRAPRPGGLYAVKPILSNESMLGTEKVTAMQQRVSAQATVVSVDGDLFGADGHPTGMLMRDGVLDHAPLATRSSAGFDTAGTLHVDRVGLYARWKGTGQRRPIAGVDQSPTAGQVVLFTSAWGAATPKLPDAVDAVLSPFPPSVPNAELSGPVTRVVAGGGTAIPPGGAVLQARGPAISKVLQAEAPVGTTVTIRLGLQPVWTGVTQALGGGPILVRNGKAVFRSNEAFDPSQLVPRAPRAAVGQAADGSVLLVAVDGGRPGASVGMTSFELALTMQQLGAVWAMQLGSGAAATLAFDGALLNAPSNGERPVADALTVFYYGVYAPPPDTAVFSPNGDGVGDAEAVAYKLVRPSTVRAVLVGPDGVEHVVDQGHRDPGFYRFPFAATDSTGAPLPEGTWRWHVDATDDSGAASSDERTFSFDLTLGAEQVAPAVLALGPAGGTVTVGAQLTRPASVTLRIETAGGVTVATLPAVSGAAGPLSLTWDARLPGGGLVRAGRYVAHLVAVSSVGTSELETQFTVRRI